ncbi:MAG: quinate 5-dehydrogenase [Candidatus Caldatribacterium sp.]|uniref:quinate 5-dehydrogenase n=1 Tax=Candidatus Caldatribacterium sp. TaxID=2282143 RepID=UPI00299667D0|nr:quinate 5-dehydrogenase [Candidatus Caldatribacterium sp.]MCX7730980.1 quinate 5-dehydrogenase [Candidatus Caldatribacterium sp.]MDW8080588.1 quinate 5-dehydrogenase [Candidatus Calescibacterium sp.]
MEIELLGCRFIVERIGVDGDKQKFVALLRELDGRVDCFGLGGADLYLRAGKYCYEVVDVARLVSVLRKTPIVDGGELKETWEREVPRYLEEKEHIPLKGKTALIMSGMDRYGLAEGLAMVGCRLLIGDMPFALGIPIFLRHLWTLRFLSVLMMPVLRRLPIDFLYPTGKAQEEPRPRFLWAFQKSDIIAGDFLYIRKFMPWKVEGKMVITNTVTSGDVEDLRARGLAILVTTTPEMEGRSFGTNVLQAIFVALLEKHPKDIRPEEYLALLRELNVRPRVVRFREVATWKS